MLFALILTIHVYGGRAIAVVSGFETNAACVAAANVWLQKERPLRDSFAAGPDATCIRVR